MTDIASLAGTQATITPLGFAANVAVALVLGAAFAWAYGRCAHGSSRSLVASVGLLPAIVAVVIMMINGSLGTGIAVAGAFSLVRFRSAQGSASDILAIFASMALGLVCSLGYFAYAVAYTAIAVSVALAASRHVADRRLVLSITVPESIDYEGTFDDVIRAHTTACELTSVKTANMGSLYKLTYDVTLPADGGSRRLIDELRARNGNLEIALHRKENGHEL